MEPVREVVGRVRALSTVDSTTLGIDGVRVVAEVMAVVVVAFRIHLLVVVDSQRPATSGQGWVDLRSVPATSVVQTTTQPVGGLRLLMVVAVVVVRMRGERTR
jgi:hypothetical protein